MSTQAAFDFDALPTSRPRRPRAQTQRDEQRDEQRENLERVHLSIGAIVTEFCRERLRSSEPEFHMAELTSYVLARSMRAPASPDRILRQLRTEGAVKYEVVNRSQSLYRVTDVR